MILIGMLLSGSLITGFCQAEAPELLYASGDFRGIFHDDEVTASGTMVLKADVWVIRVVNDEGTTDYLPVSLEDRFKTDGLIVKFTGVLEKIPANVRMAGHPIRLSKIEAVGSEKN